MRVRPYFLLLYWKLTLLPIVTLADIGASGLELASLTELEQRLEHIDTCLAELASYSLRSGVGPIGYHSKPNIDSEWLEIDLGQVSRIEEIVVVPVVRRDTKDGFKSDAFPRRFRILAGNSSEDPGRVIAEYRNKDAQYEGIAPIVFPISQVNASWIRLEATELTTRAHSGARALVLSEILVFSGQDNVALRRPVSSSSSDEGWARAWGKDYVVDGHMPYIMNSALGEQSAAYLTAAGDKPDLILDLGQSYAVSSIHLHTIEQGDTVPQAFTGDLGIPQHLHIEGAHKADFSDAVVLLDYERGNSIEVGPIMMWRFPESSCRFVRISEFNPHALNELRPELTRIGFAEIELFANGKNVALGKPVVAIPESRTGRHLSALTDGENYYGKILPIRQWVNELAIRHRLEIERPLIAAELNHRYAQQKVWLRRLVQLALLLGVGICIIILIDRNIRIRQASRIRERIAADLHDDLGADLHTIGLYSDLALVSMDSPQDLEESLFQIREFSERSGDAARHCVNMLEAKGICEDLVHDFQDLSRRLLADLDFDLTIEGEDFLRQHSPRMRIDLFLFLKECLTNILRHSEATHVAIQVESDGKTTKLVVSDNGKGLQASAIKGIPKSLKRRARLMRASITVESEPNKGARISLKLKNRKTWFKL